MSADYKYRREAFGGILFSTITKECRFFNHLGAVVLEACLRPTDRKSVLSRLCTLGQRGSVAEEFLDALIGDRILRTCEGSSAHSGADAFFTDVGEFACDRLHAPLGVELELTLRCLRRCSYCAYSAAPEVSTSNELSRSAYQTIFRNLTETGVCYLRFTGGDPLSRVDAFEILCDADEYGVGLAVASDLTVFKESHAAALGDLKNLTALQTTLDGPTRLVADQLRGKGNFDRVTRGLASLQRHSVPTIVGTILTKLNVSHIYATAKYLSQWDVAWCVSPLYAAGRGRDQFDLIPDDADLERACDQFCRAIDERLVRPADPGWRRLSRGAGETPRHGLWSTQPWLVRSPDRILRVDPSGRCYASVHLKEIFGDAVYVGSILSGDIVALWNSSPLLNDIRARRKHNPYFGDVVDIRNIGRAYGGVKRQ